MRMIVLRLLSLFGRKMPLASAFNCDGARKVFFSGGRVDGFVDSRAKTLVPSASKRSKPEWTLVDSRNVGKDY
jgi:hypothetical protein